MNGVPAAMPVTVPVALTVPCNVLLLLQAPPVEVVASVVALPTHTDGVPVMALGSALTVTVAVIAQVVGKV